MAHLGPTPSYYYNETSDASSLRVFQSVHEFKKGCHPLEIAKKENDDVRVRACEEHVPNQEHEGTGGVRRWRPRYLPQCLNVMCTEKIADKLAARGAH